MTDPKKIFLFNSSLPHGQSTKDVLHYMGTSSPKIRGQNIGNTYISFGLLRCLFGSAVQVDHLSNAWDSPLTDDLAEKINSEYSHFIFILQDYIQDHIKSSSKNIIYEKITIFLEKIHIPIVPMSLCANSNNGFDLDLINHISTEKIRSLKIISEKSKSIGVRGTYSAELLNALGIKNVKVVGCPSYFENGPHRTIRKIGWNPEKVVTTGTYFNRNLFNNSHILQDELYFINLIFMGGNSLPKYSNITSMPFNIDEIPTSLQFLLKAMRGQLEFFSDPHQWSNFYRKNKHCLTLGTRLHSSIFSINNGTPAIATNPDSRSRETCEYLKIPYNPSIGSASDIKNIYTELDVETTNNAYPQLYKTFLSYLNEHGLTPETPPNDTKIIDFPKLEKAELPHIIPQLYKAFTDLSKSLERESITIETFGGERVSKAKKFLRKLVEKTPDLSAEDYYNYMIQAFGKK